MTRRILTFARLASAPLALTLACTEINPNAVRCQSEPRCTAESDGEGDGASGSNVGSETGEGSSATSTTESLSTTMHPPESTTTGGLTDTSETTGSTTATPECRMSQDCGEPTEPICLQEACVGCEAASAEACAERDAAFPVCAPTGACVQCSAQQPAACVGETPVCDGTTGQCTGCAEHDQCAVGCNRATGACLDETCVLTVNGDGGADHESITAALAEAEDGCVVVIHAQDGDVPYTEALTVANRTVGLFAAEGEQPRVQGVGPGSPTLRVEGDSVVLLRGLTLSGNTGGPGIEVDGATAYLERTQVVSNAGGGVVLTSDSNLFATNVIIGGNGNGAGTTPGVRVVASQAELIYTTIARNDATNNDSLSCEADATVTLRNSIIVGRDSPSIDCDGATILTSAIDEDIDGNTNVGAMNIAWFDNAGAGQFTLSATGAPIFAGIARWRTGDPATDIDGNPRPTTDNGMDYAGADIP